MRKWTMIIDVAKCENCNNCFLACKDEHVDNEWRGYTAPQPRHGQRWMNIQSKERGFFPMIDVAYRPTPCMHCDDAPCIARARNGAVYKRKDGVVLIDPVKAVGQKELVDACPYHAIYWNEQRNVPQKCTLCAHLLDQGWDKPRCAHSCPTGALSMLFVDDVELEKTVVQEKLETLHPALGSHPRVYYKNLYRYACCFLGGSVATEKDGVVDCAVGATVTLCKDGKEIDRIVTGNYGDFKFDRLPPNSGDYLLAVETPDFGAKAIWATIAVDSVNLGVICLEHNGGAAVSAENPVFPRVG